MELHQLGAEELERLGGYKVIEAGWYWLVGQMELWGKEGLG